MVAIQKLKKPKQEPNGVEKLEMSLKNKKTGALNTDI